MKSFDTLTNPGLVRPWRIFPALLLVCTAQTQAQTVYRCGSSYSDAPCPQGQALQVDDARSETQRHEALQAAARTRAMADKLEATRQQEERAQQAQALAAEQTAKAEIRQREHLARQQAKAERLAAQVARERRRRMAGHPHRDEAQESPWFEAVVVPPMPRKKGSAHPPERTLPGPVQSASAPASP